MIFKIFILIPVIEIIVKIIVGLSFILMNDLLVSMLQIIIGNIILFINILKIIYYGKVNAYLNVSSKILQSILGIIIGIIILINPNITYTMLTTILGLWIVLLGIIKISIAIQSYSLKEKFFYPLLEGIIQSSLGIFTLFNTFEFPTMLCIFIGIYFILSAIDSTIVLLKNKR